MIKTVKRSAICESCGSRYQGNVNSYLCPTCSDIVRTRQKAELAEKYPLQGGYNGNSVRKKVWRVIDEEEDYIVRGMWQSVSAEEERNAVPALRNGG